MVEKRGLAFFSFFNAWIKHAHQYVSSESFIWSIIPAYNPFLKAFLLELKERSIVEYPEILIDCACTLLYNLKMLNILVRILFSKTNIYDFHTFQETFILLSRLFTAYFKLSKVLPTTFDNNFFILGIKISLEDENGLNVARCLWFIYNQYHLLLGELRKEIVYELVIQKHFQEYFFH